jgi:hypothetical protein
MYGRLRIDAGTGIFVKNLPRQALRRPERMSLVSTGKEIIALLHEIALPPPQPYF